MLEGFEALGEGIRLVMRPGLRRYVIVPVIIILVVYSLTLYGLVKVFTHWLDEWIALIPHWLDWLGWILIPLITLTLIVIAFFTFTLMVNLLASPFYGFLVERVENELGMEGANDQRSLGRQAWDGFIRELHKLSYILPRMLILFLLGWVPVVHLITPFLWLVFSFWSVALEYLDYTMDVHEVSFKKMLKLLGKLPIKTLGFGFAVSVLLWIPIVNLIVMPAAVAAGVIMWRDSYGKVSRQLGYQSGALASASSDDKSSGE